VPEVHWKYTSVHQAGTKVGSTLVPACVHPKEMRAAKDKTSKGLLACTKHLGCNLGAMK